MAEKTEKVTLKKVPQKELSVINIVEEMVREGRPEKEIISALKTVGVKEEQAKKLLLLGEADTFNLLKRELSKIIESELAAKKMEIDNFISQKAEESAKKVQEEITGKIGADVEAHVKDSLKDLDTFKDLSLSKQNEFQSRMERTVSGMGQLVEKSRKKIEETADKVDMFELDITEAKLKGFAVKNRRMRDTLFVLGIIFSTLSFYLIFSFLNATAGIEQVIAIISSGLIAAALLYAGSII